MQNYSMPSIAEIISRLPIAKAGALRIWGDWFGRPYDNIHKAVDGRAEGSCLCIRFDGGEALEVWGGSDIEVSVDTFRIRQAARVRWTWFKYGFPQTSANRYYLDYNASSGSIVASTNIDWFTPRLSPKATFPAVELL